MLTRCQYLSHFGLDKDLILVILLWLNLFLHYKSAFKDIFLPQIKFDFKKQKLSVTKIFKWMLLLFVAPLTYLYKMH